MNQLNALSNRVEYDDRQSISESKMRHSPSTESWKCRKSELAANGPP